MCVKHLNEIIWINHDAKFLNKVRVGFNDLHSNISLVAFDTVVVCKGFSPASKD